MMYWLSFCDEKLPEGSRFLGVAIVEARSVKGAIVEAHRRGINPGGSVASWAIHAPEGQAWARPYRNRLLQLAEVERVFGPTVGGKTLQRDLKEGANGLSLACEHRNEELKP